jgi:hypothetical protein
VCLIVPIEDSSEPPTSTTTRPARRRRSAGTQAGGEHVTKRKIGRIETFFVPPRWLFVRVESDDGAVGWGEASLEGHAEAVDGAFEALRDRFIGHDPRRIEDIWQVAYRGGFYRGGPVLMSALAGLEQALWDLKGKALGLPRGRCSAARCATRSAPMPGSAATGRTRSPRPPKARREQGFTAVKMNATAELDWIGTPKLFDEVGEARRGGAGGGHGRRARFPRPGPPADGQAAGQGARAARPAVHRGAVAVGESRGAGADRGAGLDTRSRSASGSIRGGTSSRSSSAARSTSSSPT